MGAYLSSEGPHNGPIYSGELAKLPVGPLDTGEYTKIIKKKVSKFSSCQKEII